MTERHAGGNGLKEIPFISKDIKRYVIGNTAFFMLRLVNI